MARKARDNENSCERQVEDAICYLLDQEGTPYVRRKWAQYGAPDILTDDAIYECKSHFIRTEIYGALGQLMIYSTIFPGRRLVVAAFCGLNNHDLLRPVTDLGFDVVLLEHPTYSSSLWRTEGLLKGPRKALAVNVWTHQATVPLRFEKLRKSGSS
jgi:hypothetical protein